MIRTAYPLPSSSPFRQVQSRLEVAGRRTRRALRARRQNLAAASSAASPSSVTPVVAVIAPSTAHPNREKEKAALEAFYDKYDNLTNLICLAAQEGVTATRESRYQVARIWLSEAYPAGIQQGVASYLKAATGEEKAAADPFLCFWTPPTLSELLQNDDGSLIERMEQTQNALAAWEKALCGRAAASATPRHY